MSYSSTAKASMVLDALMELVRDTKSSNVWRNHFYEIGRENSDGAITGKVWRFTSGEHGDDSRLAVRAGSFRIDAEGRIVRFPATTALERKQACSVGLSRYERTFAPRPRITFTVME